LAGTTKKTATTKKRPQAQPQQKPVRREIWGIVLLVLTLCVGVGYFGIHAIFVDWLAVFLKGMVGYGYWLTAPALLLGGLILLFHHGRPVRLRVTCTLLLPVLFGSLCHMAFSTTVTQPSLAAMRTLWTTGTELQSGGAVSGALAVGAVAVFSKVASIIIFTALFVVLCMISFRLTVGALIEKSRSRPQYEPEPEPEPAPAPKKPEPAVRLVPLEEPRRLADPSRPRPAIDIPLDDAPLTAKPKKQGLLTGFFRQKSDQQKTPDQLLAESAAKAAGLAAPAPAAGSAAIPAAAPTAPAPAPACRLPLPRRRFPPHRRRGARRAPPGRWLRPPQP
jgi:S-DNA-T family DNA segregation ATPase FtsK/SpoIIIE